MDQNTFRYFRYLLSFLAWNPCKILRNKSDKFKLFFRGLLAPLIIIQKSFPDGQGGIFLRSVKYFFRAILAPLKMIQKSSSDGLGIFFEKCKLCFSRIFDPLENHENVTWTTPFENLEPWDHAQMMERKTLFRIALSRALYDQLRP